MGDSTRHHQFRALLVLGRVSNLPTVWSNCLAAWWLGGGRTVNRLPLLLAGATGLYLGGMFLNDLLDAASDRRLRPERPIPAGEISPQTVWIWAQAWLGIGALLLILLGQTTGALALLLLVTILGYDALHQRIAFAPLLMAGCRLLLYLVAASTGARGVTGWAIWCGLGMAVYVLGVSLLARPERAARKPGYGPTLLLATPIALAVLLHSRAVPEGVVLLALVLGLWITRSLRPAFWSEERAVAETVSLLLAGIVLVDWLAVADAPREFSLVFLLLFGAALVFQRFVPAS